VSFLENIGSLLEGRAASGGQQQAASPEQHASIMQALLEHAGQQPGGLPALLEGFRQNGLGSHVDGWLGTAPGQPPVATVAPEQVQQGLGSGAIASIAQRTGLGPEVISAALAAGLPLLVSHLSRGSGQLPAEAGSGASLAGLAQGLLGRVL
jgi:uncharacterized protein YidB (DUF937 family)